MLIGALFLASTVVAQRDGIVSPPIATLTLTDSPPTKTRTTRPTISPRPTSSPCPIQRCVNCPSGHTVTSTLWPDGCWDRCVCTPIATPSETSTTSLDCPLQRCVNCPSGYTVTSTLWDDGCWDRCVCTPAATGTATRDIPLTGKAEASVVPRNGGAPLYSRCGGAGYTGPTTCGVGTCHSVNEWYSKSLFQSTETPSVSDAF